MDLNLQKYADMGIELSMTYLPKLALAVVTLFVGLWLVKMIMRILDKALRLRHVDASLISFLESALSVTLKIIVFITVAGMVGVQMTSFVALLGAAGLAVGLALQGSLANLAGGVLILFFRPYTIGDTIEVSGLTGKVHKIEIFNTVITTPDNKTIVIPNGQASNESVTNFSSQANRRVDLVYGIAYDDDIEKARKILLDLADKDERILKDPETKVFVGNLGDSAVELYFRPWVATADYWPVTFDMNENVKNAFDANGLSFPFPQREMHMITK